MKFGHPFRLLALLLVLFASQLSAQINLDIAKQALSSEDWLAYAPDKAADKVVKAIEGHAADPATLVLYSFSAWAYDALEDRNKVGKALLKACDDGENLAAFGANARDFSAMAARTADALGRYQVAMHIRNQLRGLQEWKLAGPFAGSWDGDQHHNTLPPELVVDANATMQGEYEPLVWKAWKRVTPTEDQFDLSNQTRRTGAGWFAWTALNNAGAEREVLFDFDVGSGGVKAWLDGKMIFKRRAVADASRDDIAQLTLPAGAHSLVIKFGENTSSSVRICDPTTRLPIKEITASQPSEDAAPFVLSGDVAAAASPFRQRAAPFEAYLAKNPDEVGAIRVLTALIQLDTGEEELALEHWHRAKAWREEATPDAKVADFFYNMNASAIATDGERNKSRREALAWLVENVEGEVMASFETAKQHASESRQRKAVNTFKAVLKRKDHWSIRLRLASFYESEGWGAEARDERLRVIAAERKKGTALPLALVDIWSNIAGADQDAELQEKLLQMVESSEEGTSYRTLMARYYLIRRHGLDKKDNATRALAIMEKADQYIGYTSAQHIETLAEIAEINDRIDEAKKAYTILRDRSLNSFVQYSMKIAKLLYRNDRVAAAAEAFHATLDVEPSEFEARKYLDLIEGKHLELKHALNSDVTYDMLDLLKAEDFPKASAGYILDEDVWVVNADGSFQSFEQRIVKILAQGGVDRYGRHNVQGDVSKVRTMLADGSESEPATVRGNSFEFPNVAPGNAVHWITRNTHRASRHKVLEDMDYYFAERDVTLPTAISRLVIVIDPKTPLHYRQDNMEDVSFSESTNEQGKRVLIWERRNPQSLKREPAMPGADEYRPTLTFTRDVNEWAKQMRETYRRAGELPKWSWLIRQTSEEIMKPFAVKKFASAKAMQLAKAKAIYDWVNKTIKVEGYSAHPHLTLIKKEGSREELFKALMHASNVSFSQVFVGNKEEGLFTERYFDSNGFYSSLFVVAEDTYVDLSNRQAPFGRCGAGTQGARAVKIHPERGDVELFFLPKNIGPSKPEQLEVTLTIDAESGDATLDGTLREDRAGWAAREEDREASPTERKRSLSAVLSSDLPGLTINDFKLSDVEALGVDYVRTFEASLDQAARKADNGDLTIVPHLTNTAESFGGVIESESRKFDLLLRVNRDSEITLRYRIPAGYALKELPKDSAMLARPFTYRLTYRVEGDELVVRRTMRVISRRIPVADYKSFKAQVKSIGEAEKQKVVLRKIAR